MLSLTFDVLHGHGVPFYSFNSGSAGRALFFLSITADSATCSDPMSEPFTEVTWAVQSARPSIVWDYWKQQLLAMHEGMKKSRGVISNTVATVEEDLQTRLKCHPDMAGVAVYNVGPLFQTEKEPNAQNKETTSYGEASFSIQFFVKAKTFLLSN